MIEYYIHIKVEFINSSMHIVISEKFQSKLHGSAALALQIAHGKHPKGEH